jgi:hypothetical protein
MERKKMRRTSNVWWRKRKGEDGSGKGRGKGKGKGAGERGSRKRGA